MPNPPNRRRTGTYRPPNKNQSSWGSYGASYKPTGGTRKNDTVRNNLQNKINSYRCLWQQMQYKGTTKPTPATITRFTNLVNKGAYVWCISGNNITRWTNWPTPVKSAPMAMKGLKKKWGTAIKAVTPTGHGNTFLVATVCTYKGKPFKFPNCP